ncbi:MAG: hypothetical protein ACKOX2_09775 [Microcystaceae cyanobacterium]
MNGFWMAFLLAQGGAGDALFQQLQTELRRSGFQVIEQLPPQRGAYGQLEAKNRRIWINPIVFDLGIANPTLIHEAVHAAQVCAGKGKPKALGLDLEPIAYARPFFFRYQDIDQRDLEREAYAVQTQPNGYELVTSLLKQYCQSRPSQKSDRPSIRPLLGLSYRTGFTQRMINRNSFLSVL